MIKTLVKNLKTIIKGEVFDEPDVLEKFSRDAGFFKVLPEVIVMPRDVGDIKALVKYVSQNKEKDSSLSLTVRAGGSDMSGGPVNESIIVDVVKHLNKFKGLGEDEAAAEPGMFYRDFERETLKKGLIFPSFPASRELCAIGGIVANNAGGEKTLTYGKTEKYVRKIKAVLADGNEYVIKPLGSQELKEKMAQPDFEGKFYRQIFKLVKENYNLLQKAKPQVSKNSAGYYLWNIWDKEREIFDLTQLFVGSQGTLGIITEATLGLVKPKEHSRILAVFLKDTWSLGKIVKRILEFEPETLESYDDHTLKLALRFFFQFAKLLGGNIFSLGFKFLPELFIILTSGFPKLIITAEFSADTNKEAERKAKETQVALKKEFGVKTRLTRSEIEAEKYRVVRRESFNLLRQKIKGRQTAPFIDDLVVKPEKLPQFLPKLEAILADYPELIYTITGHMGNGNFHIIPLMDLADPKSKEIIRQMTPEVYNLVLEFGGSITAEHNDGLIRTPFLKMMYGPRVYELFKETKNIFDPQNIFNPNKKVGDSFNYTLEHIIPK